MLDAAHFEDVPADVHHENLSGFALCFDMVHESNSNNADDESDLYLRAVSVPSSVEVLRDKCFDDGKGLLRVTFGVASSLERVGYEAFAGCDLKEILILSSVAYVGDKSFSECTCLSRVTFAETVSVRPICFGAFYGCGLTEIRIPDI